MCHSQNYWLRPQISRSKNQAYYWMCYSTPWLFPYSFPINFSSVSVKCRGFLCLPTQVTLLLLIALYWKHEFSSFSLPLHVAPFCYLTLPLYDLTLSSILTCSLHKSCNPCYHASNCWRLFPDERAMLVLCVISVSRRTLVDKENEAWNKTQCYIC